MQFFFSCQSTFGDGSDSSAMCKFLPIRVWNMEPSSRDPRGSKFDQHVRSVGQSVTSDSETHPGGTTEQRRQQRHLEGEDVLQVLHGHPWVQRKFFSNLHLLEKSYVSSWTSAKTKRRRKNEVLRLKSVLCLFVFTARIREIGDTPLRKTLEFLGGWPVVVGPSWKPPPYSVEVLLGRLRGQYNEGVLLEQWVGPDDKNSSANILQVRRQSKALWSTIAQYNWISMLRS